MIGKRVRNKESGVTGTVRSVYGLTLVIDRDKEFVTPPKIYRGFMTPGCATWIGKKDRWEIIGKQKGN